jgi:hypothetical protein
VLWIGLQERPSFSEEKEAKRLLSIWAVRVEIACEG